MMVGKLASFGVGLLLFGVAAWMVLSDGAGPPKASEAACIDDPYWRCPNPLPISCKRLSNVTYPTYDCAGTQPRPTYEISVPAAGGGTTTFLSAAELIHDPLIAAYTREEVCGTVDGMSYSRRHRALLTVEDRKADFARAGVPWSEHSRYELDHIVPLCLGGADTSANRAPQQCDAWRGPECVAGPAAKKDRLERLACRAVCAGDMPIEVGQSWFLGDWKAAYKYAFGEQP